MKWRMERNIIDIRLQDKINRTTISQKKTIVASVINKLKGIWTGHMVKNKLGNGQKMSTCGALVMEKGKKNDR